MLKQIIFAATVTSLSVQANAQDNLSCPVQGLGMLAGEWQVSVQTFSPTGAITTSERRENMELIGPGRLLMQSSQGNARIAEFDANSGSVQLVQADQTPMGEPIELSITFCSKAPGSDTIYWTEEFAPSIIDGGNPSLPDGFELVQRHEHIATADKHIEIVSANVPWAEGRNVTVVIVTYTRVDVSRD